MIQSPIFDQFVNHSPLSVMSRATIERVFSASSLDALFDRVADAGYTRELLFSTVVDLMSRVVFRKAPHVQSAYQQRAEQIPVTLKSVYEKLQNIEPVVSAELVRHVTGRCYDVIAEMGGARNPLLAGRRVRILDGNHLAATQKRLQVTRGHTAGPLPGQALAILDPQAMVIADRIPCNRAICSPEQVHQRDRSRPFTVGIAVRSIFSQVFYSSWRHPVGEPLQRVVPDLECVGSDSWSACEETS